MGGMGGIADMLKNMGGMGGMGGGGSPFGGGANPFGGGAGGADVMGKAQQMMQNPKVREIMAKAPGMEPKLRNRMTRAVPSMGGTGIGIR